jgi:hypothetical protein
MIDEKLAVSSISAIQIKIINNDGIRMKEANYIPGKLTVNFEDYNNILSDSTKHIYLKFTYYEYISNKQIVYNYEIELMKSWLNNSFNVLYIYNLNKKKYREMYSPISKEKNYAFELDSPNGSIRLIKKTKKT